MLIFKTWKPFRFSWRSVRALFLLIRLCRTRPYGSARVRVPDHVVAEIAGDFLGGDSLLKEPKKGWFQFLLFKLLLKDLCNTTVRSLVGLALTRSDATSLYKLCSPRSCSLGIQHCASFSACGSALVARGPTSCVTVILPRAPALTAIFDLTASFHRFAGWTGAMQWRREG